MLHAVEQMRRLADYTGDPITGDEAAWALEQAATFVGAIAKLVGPPTDPG